MAAINGDGTYWLVYFGKDIFRYLPCRSWTTSWL